MRLVNHDEENFAGFAICGSFDVIWLITVQWVCNDCGA